MDEPNTAAVRPAITNKQVAIVLVALTAAAAVLRFTRLDLPPLWGDEAFTYSRVAGSYRDLLDILQYNGFGPLHYELYWAIGRRFFLSPLVMRFPTALAGTLMVPAMYFLAAQLVSRNTAVLVALLTCCSAYMMTYSRDAKMYMELWLFVALNAGCFLWWMRTGRSPAFLAWVATGLAATGLHPPGAIAFIPQPIILLTHGKAHWKKTVLFFLGTGVIASGIGGYYRYFNRWGNRIEENGWNSASGLVWVPGYNQGRSGPNLLLYTATAHLFSWEYPREGPGASLGLFRSDVGTKQGIDPRVLTWLRVATVVLLCILGAGLFPWRSRHHSFSDPQPWPLRAIWLGLWIIVPAYGLYCRSVWPFDRPSDWHEAVRTFVHENPASPATCVGALLILPILFYLSGRTFAGRARKLVLTVAVAAALWGACVLTSTVFTALHARAVATGKGDEWVSIWVPRYLGALWPAEAIVVAVLIRRLPTKAVRAVAVVVFLAVNLGQAGARVFAGTEPRIDLMAADVAASQPRGGQPSGTRAYTALQPIGMAHPGEGTLIGNQGKYYLATALHMVVPPRDYRTKSAAMLGVQLWNIADPAYIARDVEQSKRLTRIIVWEHFEPKNLPPPAGDELLKKLQPLGPWTLAKENLYPVRVHWTWQHLYTSRRREYVRAGS